MCEQHGIFTLACLEEGAFLMHRMALDLLARFGLITPAPGSCAMKGYFRTLMREDMLRSRARKVYLVDVAAAEKRIMRYNSEACAV